MLGAAVLGKGPFKSHLYFNRLVHLMGRWGPKSPLGLYGPLRVGCGGKLSINGCVGGGIQVIGLVHKESDDDQGDPSLFFISL